MKINPLQRARRQSGYVALFITLVLVAASVLLLSATLSRSTADARLNDRNSLYLTTEGAAEAGMEKVLSRMISDFDNSGEALVQSNLATYRAMVPSSSESSYWTNYNFSDGLGNNNAIYVARTTTTANAPFIALSEQYAGLSGYASTYRIISCASLASSTYNYSFTNATLQEIQLATIPVFQFAIFYNGLMEFSDCATMTNNGPVHCNTNIYVGSPNALTFTSVITAAGNITSPAAGGLTTPHWSGKVTYPGPPVQPPGYLTGQTTLTLPIGTNSLIGSNVLQILYPAQSSDTTAMSSQRYYNKAHMILMISNTTFTATFRTSASDTGVTFQTNWSMLNNAFWVTNTLPITNAAQAATNWGQYWGWLTVSTNTFYDWRESAWANITQIDVGKLTNWMSRWIGASWNTNVRTRFTTNFPFEIIYIGDWRATAPTVGGAASFSAIRLIDGQNTPPNGLTVATPNPMYIQGTYNCPGGVNLNSTNTTATYPCSVAADAVTLLSQGWSDSYSTSSSSSTGSHMPTASASDTVNTAIIAGNVTTTDTTASGYSGGAMNLTRLLEDWSSVTLTLNTSLVCLYNSVIANTQFQMPNNYYKAPSQRIFSFDLNFTQATGMPPGTPNICRVVRSAWYNPTPGDTNFTYSVGTDFVPN